MFTVAPRAARTGLGLLLAVLAHGAAAEQWYAEPRARLYGFYEDNVGLTVDDEKGSAGFIASASVTGGRRSEVADVGLSGEVVRRQYFSDADRNTTDAHFDGRLVRRIERDRLSLGAAFDIDSTLTSEEGTSGLVQQNKRRYRWQLAPGWERQLSERLTLTADASYQDVTYEDAREAGLVDYRYATLGTGLSYSLSERLQLIGRLSYDRYEADRIENSSDMVGVLGGVGYAFSPVWSVNALIGMRVAEVKTPAGTDDSTGGLFDISTTKRFETGSLRAGLNKSLTPSGSGGLLDTTGLTLDWDRHLTPRWRGLFSLAAYRNRQPSGDASGDDRDYLTLTPRLSYRLDRDLSLELGYRYRYQKYDNSDASAEANAVFFTLVYAPQRERPDLDLTR